jgi:Domain of unknown function (DUF4398)
MKANIPKVSVLHLMFPVVLAAVTGSCATGSVPGALTDARRSLVASSNGLAAALAPSYLDAAKEMLERANQEFASHGNSNRCKDYSYIAENKFELADAVARAELFRQTVGGGDAPGRGLRPEDARSSTGGPLAPAR